LTKREKVEEALSTISLTFHFTREKKRGKRSKRRGKGKGERGKIPLTLLYYTDQKQEGRKGGGGKEEKKQRTSSSRGKGRENLILPSFSKVKGEKGGKGRSNCLGEGKNKSSSTVKKRGRAESPEKG